MSRDIEHMAAPHARKGAPYSPDRATVHYEIDPDAEVPDYTVFTYAMHGDHSDVRAIRVAPMILLRSLLDVAPDAAERRAHAFRNVILERDRQANFGWTPEHDLRHTYPEWMVLVYERLAKIGAVEIGEEHKVFYKERVAQLAAVALAWLEALDP